MHTPETACAQVRSCTGKARPGTSAVRGADANRETVSVSESNRNVMAA